jgi:hypothetical protein
VVEGECKRAKGSKVGAAKAKEAWERPERASGATREAQIPVETSGYLFVD